MGNPQGNYIVELLHQEIGDFIRTLKIQYHNAEQHEPCIGIVNAADVSIFSV